MDIKYAMTAGGVPFSVESLNDGGEFLVFLGGVTTRVSREEFGKLLDVVRQVFSAGRDQKPIRRSTIVSACIEYLQMHPGEGVSLKDLEAHTGAKYSTIAGTMQRLLREGRAERSAPGMLRWKGAPNA